MIKIGIALATLLFTNLSCLAQLETNRLGKVNGLGNTLNADKSYLSPKNENSNLGNTSRIQGLSLYKKDETAAPITSKKKTSGIRTDNGLLPQESGKTPKWFTKDNKFKGEYLKNQSLGTYKNKGDFVQIYCRDHQFVDGDRIRIYVNNEIAEAGVTLSGDYIGLDVFLQEGVNKIDFEALNQGSSGPNTAEFKLYDNNGTLMTTKVWNLATGAQATVTIVKD